MGSGQEGSVTLAAVGDVAPNRDDPPSIFRHCRDALRSADIVFGQMESPLSDRGTPMFVTGWPRKLAAHNISALTKEKGAGFDVMSFACNHAMDYGWEAFYDTLDALENSNIAVVGAGRNIAQAQRPVIVQRNGVKVGFLGYLSILWPGLVAQEDIPGCIPLRASNAYQQLSVWPGTPPIIITQLFPEDKAAMVEAIKKLRPQVDVLVVSMHCGVHFIHAMIAMYQKEAAYAAIDSGADLVLQHHSHILKGIEVYKGKVVFYGLGDFALEHGVPFKGHLKPWVWDHAADDYKKRVARIKPTPGYEKHRFPHDSLKTMIAKAYIQDKKIHKVTYLPAYITPNLEPEVVTRQNPKALEVFDYVKQISEEEDLKVQFSWQGDEVLVG